MKKLTLAVAIAASAFFSATALADWVATSGGDIPADAVQGGNETDGTPLYLCRAKQGTDNGLHPGKTRKEFNGCNIGWGGKEIMVSSYEVLVNETVNWQATNGADIPANAMQGGQEDAGILYICKAEHEGGVHPGKTRKEFNGCNIGYGGKEMIVSAYEIAVVPAVSWVAASDGKIPADAVQGGNETDGTPLYLCRAKHGTGDGIHPGKIREEFSGCNIGWGGEEVAVSPYEVLVGTKVVWQATSGANIPANAMQGGQEDAGILYICKAKYEGGVHPGKTRKEFSGCNIGYGGEEIMVPEYEVLTN